MRKITCQACEAFHNNKPFKKNNTEVFIERVNGEIFCTKLILFGNTIAVKYSGDNLIRINFKGYNTVTTRERLNGLSNVSFTTKQGKLYMDGIEIRPYNWYII